MLASASFLSDLPLYRSEKPFEIIGFGNHEVPPELRSNMVEIQENSMEVADARDDIGAHRLDTSGFIWLYCPSQYINDSRSFEAAGRDDTMVMNYLEETATAVQHEMGANRVVVFDWRVSNHMY